MKDDARQVFAVLAPARDGAVSPQAARECVPNVDFGELAAKDALEQLRPESRVVAGAGWETEKGEPFDTRRLGAPFGADQPRVGVDRSPEAGHREPAPARSALTPHASGMRTTISSSALEPQQASVPSMRIAHA